MAKSLKESLKEIQILLGKPHKKIAGSLKYYLNLFNVSESGEKEIDVIQKDNSSMQTIQNKKITWVNIINPNRRLISKLAQEYPFHPLHLEDCISKAQFPKIETSEEDKYLFLLLRLPHINTDLDRITINQICLFLGKDYLVTIHEDATDEISKIFNDCSQNPEKKEALMNNSSAHLLYMIVDHLTDELSPILRSISKEVDETEDIVFDDKISGVYKIGQLRQKIIRLRRVIGPLRLLLADMVVRINKFTSRNLSVYFEDITHRVERTWETLEEARETVEIYKDADFIISTEKTNRILSVLTIIFTLTIPATVIGTFYGMNVNLPGGLSSSSWTFWGKYTTFIVILIVAIIPTLVMNWYFRKRGWF